MSAINYDVESEKRLNWLDITGGGAKDSLTVLDYFAGKAMQVYLHASMGQMVVAENIAHNAYDLAEAMLAERNKRYTPQGTIKGVTGKTYG